MTNEQSPFLSLPGGLDIAHYFIEDHCRDFDGQGADGMPLWRDDRAYCYMWLEAHVDHDLEQYFLLDIRTANGKEPFDETRDYLYVMVGVGLKVECEWHNQPVRFDAPTEDHLDRLNNGLTWFVSKVVSETEGMSKGEK
jgi:hypothetical protein